MISGIISPYRGYLLPSHCFATSLKQPMSQRAWDCNLEKEAQENAEQCTDYTSQKYGFNQQKFKCKTCDANEKAKEVLNTWWKEVRSATLSDGNKYDKTTVPHFGQAISTWYGELEKAGGIGEDPTYKDDMKTNGLWNYANLANEANTKVGCAVKSCQKQGYTLVACQYDGYIFSLLLLYHVCSTTMF
ncbi:SCP-like protein [Ancylostoma ceylanicum]|uniref:SCP-like protein n=1 Tax=Ancylostoma ceylanicum TaxID=53326 RepID=A0A0D6MA02_9BILA|nr:SCP-like protein [Ancylostoma ceylanicum]